jgi:hypothetical protein
LGHSGLDHLLLELGLSGLSAGRELGSLSNRTNLLAAFVVENSDILTADGELASQAIVRRAIELVRGFESGAINNLSQEMKNFIAALKKDDLVVEKAGSQIFAPDGLSIFKQEEQYESAVFPIDSEQPVDQVVSKTLEHVPSEPEGFFVKPKVFKVPRVNLQPKLVAVMMPFDAAFDDVYAAIKRACADAGLECQRADDLWEDEVLVEDIFSLIYRAGVVVCDLTGRNPNVFYETGIAHTMGRPVVPLAQNDTDVPSDMRARRYLHYLNNGEGRVSLTAKLSDRLRTLTSQTI